MFARRCNFQGNAGTLESCDRLHSILKSILEYVWIVSGRGNSEDNEQVCPALRLAMIATL